MRHIPFAFLLSSVVIFFFSFSGRDDAPLRGQHGEIKRGEEERKKIIIIRSCQRSEALRPVECTISQGLSQHVKVGYNGASRRDTRLVLHMHTGSPHRTQHARTPLRPSFRLLLLSASLRMSKAPLRRPSLADYFRSRNRDNVLYRAVEADTSRCTLGTGLSSLRPSLCPGRRFPFFAGAFHSPLARYHRVYTSS